MFIQKFKSTTAVLGVVMVLGACASQDTRIRLQQPPQPIGQAMLVPIRHPLRNAVVIDYVSGMSQHSYFFAEANQNAYSSLAGVIYEFRADFVIPDEQVPKAFIEVRKSSSRHASLYAKDKMFSAINWKGRHRDMLAILVVDGEWTAETLRVMARVFDYVVPLRHVNDLARSVAEYLAGDKTKLKWLIDFKITSAYE